jgi:hypothetical protein
MGDEPFFAALNAGSGGSGGWGSLDAAWNAGSFEQALSAPPRSEDRTRLVGHLVDRFFTAYGGVAGTTDEAYVSLDDGLSIVSKHARDLGYDAVSLFRYCRVSSRAEGIAGEGEVVLAGPRVKVPGGRVIVPWSERTRYGMRKNGYHGGATPQEMIVPIAVVTAGVQLLGWVETAPEYPDWWQEPLSSPFVAAPVVIAPPPVRSRKGRPAPLFEELERPVPAAASAARAWIDALLRSDVFAAQKQLAGRVAPPDEQFHHLLSALEERGGKLTRLAPAQRLGLPLVRIGSFVAAARRVLNVEGYPVLRVDEASDTIELNRDLLVAQFELTPGGGR